MEKREIENKIAKLEEESRKDQEIFDALAEKASALLAKKQANQNPKTTETEEKKESPEEKQEEKYKAGDIIDLTNEKFTKINPEEANSEKWQTKKEEAENPIPQPPEDQEKKPEDEKEIKEEKKSEEKESDEKKTHKMQWKILEMFHKKEKEKFEPFSEEEKNNFKEEISQMIRERKSEEEIKNKIYTHAEERKNREIENGPFTERAKKGIGKGIELWDKWGTQEDEKYKREKRLIKMITSIALIAGISSIISPTMMSGQASSYIGKRLFFGVGVGSALSALGEIKSEKKEKIQKILKIALPIISAGVAIGTGGIAMGLAVGGAAAAGYGFSKLAQGKWSEEKIQEKIKNAQEKIDLSTLETNLTNIEKEIGDILKKAENIRLTRKIIGGAVAIGSSVAILEISGTIHHSNETQTGTPATETKSEEMITQPSQPVPTPENPTIGTQVENQTQPIQTTEPIAPAIQPEIPTHINEAKMEDIIISKGEGIEHAFIRQIEHNPDLAKELGYKGDLSDTKALHEFAGRQAHIVALKTGYVDNAGHEVRIAEADKVGYEIKMENGNISVEEKDINGQTIETHQEGDKFEDNVNKDSHEYIQTESTPTNQDLIENQTSPTNVEQSNLAENQVNPITKEKMEINENETLTPKNNLPPETTPDINNSHHLSAETLKQVENTYQENIEHIFPTNETKDAWMKIENSSYTTAERVMALKEDGVIEAYKPLVNYMHKLHEITGLNPIGETLIQSAETNREFIERALQKAAEMGQLEKLKL